MNELRYSKYAVPYVINKDDLSLSQGSDKKILCKCTSCGLKRLIAVNYLVNKGFSCRICSKNIPIGERIFYVMSLENDVEVIPQKKFKDLKSAKGYYYSFDFYLPSTNTIVELHGEQHYTLSKTSNWTPLEVTKKRDFVKERYCDDNNIKYVSIDCSQSDYNYIITNILNSDVGNLFTNIDKEEIIIKSLEIKHSKNVKSIISDFKKGMTYNELIDKYKIPRHTIVRILERSGNYKKVNSSNVEIICLNTGVKYKSIKEVSIEFEVPYYQVVNNLKQKTKSVNTLGDNFVFAYADDSKNITKNENKKQELIDNKNKIVCVNTGKIFNNTKEAYIFFNMNNPYNINRCLKGLRKSAGKHPITGEKLTWEYVD